MAKNNKVFKYMFYPYKWRASARVSELSLAERGLYNDLLNASFVADDCGLPADEKKLAQLARTDIEEFQRVWPNVKQFFYKKQGRLYNETMVEEKKRAQENYDRCVNNGKKGGRPPKGSEANSKTHRLSQTEPRDNPQVKQPEPEPEPDIDSEIETPEERPPEPESIGDILAGGSRPNGMDIITRVKQLLPEKDWNRSGHWFKYMVNELSSFTDLNEVVTKVENCRNPAIRRAKDLGELNNPGGFLRKKFKELAKQNGIDIPSDSQARNNCERTN